jgi:S-adenosylmethionine-diacylglycerol 3-amino-3-carboxypropyl transferase
MSVKPQDQVVLFDLLFGMSWEDPASDLRALAIRPGETVMTVTSGGCNTLTLLLEDPAKIYAVDINPTQSYLLELKCAAIRRLDGPKLRAFLGLASSTDRLKTFEQLRRDLSQPALAYWSAKSNMLRQGVVNAGRYESFVRLFGRAVKLMQGRKRVENFFRCETIEQQQAYFDNTWNTVQWRLLFKLLANKRMLAKRGLTADYFKFDDGATSFADSFFLRARKALRDIPIKPNYFIAQYLRGNYLDDDAVPAYLLTDNLSIVRDRIDRIENVVSDAQGWMGRQHGASIDAFCLSNICELMSPEETARLFTEVARTARPSARISFRNLIVPRGVPQSLANSIVLNEALSSDLLQKDRSFVYSRVQAYNVVEVDSLSTPKA